MAESSGRMPALFVAHGSPMLALDVELAQRYRQWGERLPRARAVLVISAHWETEQLLFGEVAERHSLIYDFYGFARELYALQYPAPGAAQWLEPIRALLDRPLSVRARGLDHGVWIPLRAMWPQADVPILQMSLAASLSDAELYALGQRLAPLREQGLMVIGAGTLTHPLAEGLRGHYSAPPQWVLDFDHWVQQCLQGEREQLLRWRSLAPAAARNHPTAEHFRPLLLVAGCAGTDERAVYPIAGFDMGVFSLRCLQFG